LQHTTPFVVPEIDAVVVDDFVIHIILIIVLALSRFFFFDGLVGGGFFFFSPSPFLVLIFKLLVDAVAVGS
jgi:hypothetical protein